MPRDTQDATQSATVHVRMADGSLVDFTSQKILGCDGMNSRIRLGLEAWAAQEDKKAEAAALEKKKKGKKKSRFGLHFVDSPSAGLRYKILTLQDGFPLTVQDPTNITEKSLCYSYVGLPKGYFTPPLRLGLLPYKMKNIPRTANIITKPSAEIFTLKTGGEVLAFLRRELPQCDIEKMITPEEAERFAQSPGGYFPRPQYCLDAQQVLGGGKGGVVLLGDAIHAFPPDLGAGVNLAVRLSLSCLLLSPIHPPNQDTQQLIPTASFSSTFLCILAHSTIHPSSCLTYWISSFVWTMPRGTGRRRCPCTRHCGHPRARRFAS